MIPFNTNKVSPVIRVENSYNLREIETGTRRRIRTVFLRALKRCWEASVSNVRYGALSSASGEAD